MRITLFRSDSKNVKLSSSYTMTMRHIRKKYSFAAKICISVLFGKLCCMRTILDAFDGNLPYSVRNYRTWIWIKVLMAFYSIMSNMSCLVRSHIPLFIKLLSSSEPVNQNRYLVYSLSNEFCYVKIIPNDSSFILVKIYQFCGKTISNFVSLIDR